MRRYRREPKMKLSMNQMILIVIVICLLAGTCAGSIAAARLNETRYSKMQANTDVLLQEFSSGEINRSVIFGEGLFKYGKIAVIIWLLAFVPVGGIVSLLIIMSRGAGLGFTTGFLVRCYGNKGFLTAALLYLPQNIILIPAWCFMTYSSIHFVLLALKEKEKVTGRNFMEYIVILMICLACVMLASFIEAYMVPSLTTWGLGM